MIYFLRAEIVTLGAISIGFGSSTQQLCFIYSDFGLTEKALWFIRTLTLLLGLASLAGKLYN